MNFEKLNEENLKEIAELLINNGYKISKVEKNPWEGVEYAKCKDTYGYTSKIQYDKIYRVNLSTAHQDCTLKVTIKDLECVYLNAKRFVPATVEDYKLQLIAEAKERFGEIKDGDRFNLSELGLNSNCSISLDYKDTLDDADYMEYCDELRLIGFTLYKQGRWGEKLEDAKVVKRVVDYKLDEENEETTITMTFELNQYKRLTNLFQIRLTQYMSKVASEIERMNKEFN